MTIQEWTARWQEMERDAGVLMDEGIKILAGPFRTRKAAWADMENELNPEGWSGLRTPKACQGYDGQWYVIIDHIGQ